MAKPKKSTSPLNPLNEGMDLIREGMNLKKCRKCGCMGDVLEALTSLPSDSIEKSTVEFINSWLKRMQPIEYPCIGCEKCYPAEALNVLSGAYPELLSKSLELSCTFTVRKDWPPVVGEYSVLSRDPYCPVAISTLGSPDLVDSIAERRPKGLSIIGKTETENIGIDKLVKNTITNPVIRFLMLAGKDTVGHFGGKTIFALKEFGVDDEMRVINSPGKRPILRNVSLEEVEAFRRQVEVVNHIGCEDVDAIIEKTEELSANTVPVCTCCECNEITETSTVPVFRSTKPLKAKLDKAGYFVITPQYEKGIISVEHYSYDNELLHIIEGDNAKNICATIIDNNWVTELSHASYIGRELDRAELSMKLKSKYIQEGA